MSEMKSRKIVYTEFDKQLHFIFVNNSVSLFLCLQRVYFAHMQNTSQLGQIPKKIVSAHVKFSLLRSPLQFIIFIFFLKRRKKIQNTYIS